jgi:hypothetical protein
MRYGSSIVLVVLAVCTTIVSADAFDESKYPDWTGQWSLGPPANWDRTKPPGRGQQAPLTAEYQAIFEANLADQATGGQGTDPTYICIPDGMPRAMNVVFPMEIVILPKTTYVMMEYLNMLRRIYTDGRDWPKDQDPAFMGYSIGKWIDEGVTGQYNMLEVETRNMKGPRAFDPSGIPLHSDNQTVVKERIYLDKADADILHDEVTTIDNALIHPWTVTKNYRRDRNPIWTEAICTEANPHIRIGKENYMLSADGYLMPVKKNQQPPDLRYFGQSRK